MSRTPQAAPAPTPVRSRRRRAVWILAVPTGLVLAGAGAESAATAAVEHRVEAALRPRLGETTARLSGSGLAALLTGRVDAADVSGDRVPVGEGTGSVRLHLEGLTRAGEGGAEVDSLSGTVTVPLGSLRGLLAGAGGDRPRLPPGLVPGAVRPADGGVEIEVRADHLALGPGR
ncbi:LmeA family phospholipid-binding protein [Streptomyces sp. NPDC086023]|uniref:LmeA family phospholipid-binding protein n=1 Tax=Streptomyces sp. NPDC086023 TaxID=3365746 RepID=UPI0037CDCC4F